MIQGKSRMRFRSSAAENIPATVHIAHFHGENGVGEYHLTIQPTEYADIRSQSEWLQTAYQNALATLGLDSSSAVLRRYFCSDLPNQANQIAYYLADDACAVSCVGQPPLPPAKIALWAYHVSDPNGALEKEKEGTSLTLKRGELAHIWTTGLTHPDADTSLKQTEGIFAQYEGILRTRGLTVADNLLRTWFFVQNVDANYHGLVAARKAFFASRGLTPLTHYIASTGIEGRSADIAALVMMDAYAISGVRPEQIRYLSAPEHLCPTHLYGVTFERGVSVSYQDRTHINISGTASIDKNGLILHPGDVRRQLARTLENVEALLKDAGATLADAVIFIVYVRDPSDLQTVQSAMQQKFPTTPTQILTAPVCRPGWLVEIECQAVIPVDNPGLPSY